jgi:FtsH-binding integral membrane protein
MNPVEPPEVNEETTPLIETQRNTDIAVQIENFKITHTLQLGFIRKVYLLLTFQLVFTFVWIALVMENKQLRTFVQHNNELAMISGIGLFVSLYALLCFLDFQRTVPNNYIMLSVFTVCEAYFVAFICSFSDRQTVLLAGAMTITVSIALTLYAFWTRRDFTKMGGMLFVSLCVLILASVVLIMVPIKPIRVFLNVVCVILFGFYLVYDTQLIMANKTMAYSIDDYIAATLNIYIDIINIFLEILQLSDSK